MRADNLASRLQRQLPEGFFISRYPDHPHLFAGPDLLIGGEGELCALFLAKQREILRVDGLLARLTASRLALPEHMRWAVVVERSNADFEAVTRLHFQEIFGPDQDRDIARWVELSNTARGFNSVPAEIRADAQMRYQILFQVTALRRSRFHIERDPFQLLDSIQDQLWARSATISLVDINREGRPSSRRNIVQGESFSVGATSFTAGKSAREKIRPFCIYSLRRAYVLDNGVPYPQSSDPNILIIDEHPSARFDPLKPVRCANFAGWALTRADDPRDVAALADRLSESFRKYKL